MSSSHSAGLAIVVHEAPIVVRDRLRSAKHLRRVGARGRVGECGRFIARVVAACGIVPTRLAIQLGVALQGRSEVAYYVAVRRLIARGVLTQASARSLALSATQGLRSVLIGGPEWPTLAAQLGTPGATLVAADDSPRLLTEQLMLAAFVMGRLATGWRLASGTEWLRATALATEREPTRGRLGRVTRVLQAGSLANERGSGIVGVVPPAGVKIGDEGLPTLLVGARYTTAASLAGVLELAAAVAPFAIVLVHADDRTTERVRRLVVERTGTTAYCPVRALRVTRGPKWRAFWQDISDAIALTAADRAPQLGRWFLAAAQPTVAERATNLPPIREVTGHALIG